jgi:O-methyltransferase
MGSILIAARKIPFIARLRTRVLLRLHRHRAMRYPTFNAALHDQMIPHTQYVRFAAVGLALQRIREENIAGHLAEVGVYQGEMSRFIHSVMPERTLYLFDTFEGFPERHLEPEQRHETRFRGTSTDQVLQTIGSRDNIVVRKGIVPDTLAGLEQERFAFVLLDLDLYQPTKESLEFFYPRLNHGAYLLVHDYNSPESSWACKRALDAFLQNKPETLLEVPDVAGTAMFRKL